jgi:hypothetical protein
LSLFLNRLRATSAAAAAPNSSTIGGPGTGEGPPEEPLEPWLLDPWLEVLQPLELLQPLEPLLLEP